MAALIKRWRLKPPPDPAVVNALTTERSTPVLATLLAQRGIRTPEEATIFYRPSLEHLHDPFLMKDMERAVERIEQALGDKEPIMVYGDYDVDGTTSVALVYGMLAPFAERLYHYVPDRYEEGYGISRKGIDHAAAKGVKLIIALDCGIKAVDKVAHATEKGIDFIICDHHLPGKELPGAVAILNPKRADCPYPYKELSGCGVGFKLMQAFAQRNGIPFRELEKALDLVAVSIGCDIVPITGENRVLAWAGLSRMNAGMKRPGLEALLSGPRQERQLTITDLVFTIGPSINAAGRIEHGQQAVELLLAKEASEAAHIAERVKMNNKTRQVLDRDITDEALALFDSDERLKEAWSTVVYQPGWHKGVVGIVASRLIEHHYRPTVVLTGDDGLISGSARSIKGFNVHEALVACGDLLERFGGHMYAAGLSLKAENLAAFQERFEAVVRDTLDPALRIPEELVDLEVGIDSISTRFVNALHGMEPFGPNNMKPVFLTRGVVAREARAIGEDKSHLKFTLHHPDRPHDRYDAIAFGMAEQMDTVGKGEPFSLLYTLEKNVWRGTERIQLNVKDIKAGTENVLFTGRRSPLMERNPA